MLAPVFAAGYLAACGSTHVPSVTTGKTRTETVTTNGQTFTLECFAGGAGTTYGFGECDVTLPVSTTN